MMGSIDKQATIDAIYEKANEELADANHHFLAGVHMATAVVRDMPERRWIPCNERLPEINQIVLLSTNSNNVYVGYRNKPELLWQVEEDGRKQWVYDPESYDVDIDVLPKTEDIDFYCEGVNDGGFLSITSANYNDRFEGVTAWMSLPEPYKEDKQG